MLSIILSRRDFREYDQIISLYTLEKGKVEVLARGIKKITSKNSAHLEPFSLVEVEIIPGKELNHLGGVTPINYFSNIRKDLSKSLAVGFVVGLLDRVLHEGERDERIFELLKSWLGYLDLELVTYNLKLTDSFIVKLLLYLGFDISEKEDADKDIKVDLESLKRLGWLQVTSYKLRVTRLPQPAAEDNGGQASYKILHKTIYDFMQYHLERKIEDWALVDNIVDDR
jgi:DNA repair protein RecO (recombination protein O)